VELRRKGVSPTYRLVLAALPEAHCRFPSIVEDAVRAVRIELSIKP
jgi:hypothetical protein